MGSERSGGENHMGEWKKHKGFAFRRGDYGTTAVYGSNQEIDRAIKDFGKAKEAEALKIKKEKLG